MATVWRGLSTFGFRRNLVSSIKRESSSFSENVAAKEVHAKKTLYSWKWISLLVAIPGIAYLTWKNLIVGEEHHEQREYKPWPHLRIRNKPFPWKDSDKSLFHNPLVNPGPPSDEVEESTDESLPAASNESHISKLWVEYLYENPIKLEEEREAHLTQMQKRYEEYQAKKQMPEPPIRPIDLLAEQKHAPVNKVDCIYNSS